ncbi:DNA mismatch repair endonuclease MutL [Oscillatoria sp. CS-180]|uniref:DNA mismatch repair endonuclease MutL n=1 Tax=Oscillatoria sp. CS-180 TaxID=3021720 RepID=UPI00232C575B|nr:DNA mismatch repair endonuclease MutL [Oscillatoria sp. CS-180]MDB9524463.1 DNA mismatch repair endonuclease MutL [Oscillatoria sp. CS-180]
MAGIQPLPSDVVKLMAAGEVIDSPAAVVRELAENAIDAEASRIVIEVRSHPWHIQVTDNGSGLPIEDLRRAATSHSTSKLFAKEDLWNVHSLGFRGEALHSLSRLSQLTLCSCPQSQVNSGFCVTCDRSGRPTNTTPIAMAPGTRVTVEDLFYSMPSRQEAASSQQQLRMIQQSVYHLALCHPGITWQGFLDDHPWFTLWPGQSALHVLPQIMRRIQVTDLRETDQPCSIEGVEGKIHLLMGLPDRCHRRRPDGVFTALNGRVVQLPEVTERLLTVLRRSLPRDRYPVIFIHLQVTPHQVDWHRSPDKSRVYLQHLDDWCTAIESVIEQTLQASRIETGQNQRVTQLLQAAEPEGQYRTTPNDDQYSDTPLGLKAIAQVHNRYILAEHPAGLCLIEQHIAHERVLYEELCDRWEIVPLATPISLSNLSESQVEQLQRIGLTVDPFGPDLWLVRTAPAPLVDRDDCAEALQELSLGADLDSALVATACRTAIRNGTPLRVETLQSILNAWQRTRKPQTCPHGRPICLTLNESSLARYFRRSWVIGKSHGLEP